jgi:hypothetical protein
MSVTPEEARKLMGLPVAAEPVKVSRRGGRALRKEDGISKTQAAYAREVLEPLKRAGRVIRYYHEPLKFKLADKTYYTPDYLVIYNDWHIGFIEVKGRKGDGPWCEEDAKVKIKVAAAMYPFPFTMVWPQKVGGWSEKEY